ncbi:MAG: sigma-70 family RNA polymerase sigma factor [Bacteroidales bacterium]|nr:sigma-70 family RNA polymerase sigma factor [Bacteroidales bacterium]
MKAARKRHILEEHYLDFYSRAVTILNDEDDAKDAVQEAVVKTLVHVGVRDMVAYCYRATERECINILRYKSRLQEYDEQTTPASHSQDAALHRQMSECRRLLLPMEQRVLELRHDHGYTIHETAAQVSLSPATVKRLQASAEKKLKYNMTHEI